MSSRSFRGNGTMLQADMGVYCALVSVFSRVAARNGPAAAPLDGLHDTIQPLRHPPITV
jgi:hypothetical protein